MQHILPNTFAPLLVIATAYLGLAIVQEAALDYLGAGIQEPQPSWGLMMSGSATSLALIAPWIVIFPGLRSLSWCSRRTCSATPSAMFSIPSFNEPISDRVRMHVPRTRDMSKSVLHTSLCDDLKIEYPIFLAGMGVKGKATPPELVAAVSEAGGMGILGCSWLDGDEVRRRIRAVRNLTDKPFGVDLLLPAEHGRHSVPDRAEMRARIERDFPKHAAFAKSLIEKFGLKPVKSKLAAMSPEFIRRQVDVCLEERIAVFAAGLGDPSWVVPQRVRPA